MGSHETPEQAIRREAYEELGATIEQLELFGIDTNFVEGKRDHIVVFRGTADISTTYQSWEIVRVGSFALDTLPPTTSPGTRRRIAELGDSLGSRYGPW